MDDCKPLRGEGIEIRFNKEKSEEGRRKYNVFIEPDLLAVLAENLADHHVREKPKDSKREPRPDAAGRLVIGYLVTDEHFEAADGDVHC